MRDAAGVWWARREVKPGKPVPAGFVAVETDETTGKTMGWEPMEQSPFARFHAEAIDEDGDFPAGTYELCGPKVQGNPEKYASHVLVGHCRDAALLAGVPLDFAGLREWLSETAFEGIVWHHPDGRMAKLKRRR